MSALERLQTRTLHTLGSPTVVGRASMCQVQIASPVVSSTHAMLRWTDQGWEIHDLGSRNGVFVNDTRIPAGQRVLLRDGDLLCFGQRQDPWRACLRGPPVAHAISGEATVVEQGGLLGLPAEQPEVCVYRIDNHWWLDRGDDFERVGDGAELEVAGRRWRLRLPVAVRPTVEMPGAESVALHFTVSADEEHITLQVRHGAALHDLDHRSWSYLLLTLARERLAADGLPAAEQGWVYHDVLAQRLGMNRSQFNMAIFRARQQLSQLGVPNAQALIERRRGSGQIRIGDAQLIVT